MNKTPLIAATFAALLSTAAQANQEGGTYDTDEAHGSAMQENHLEHGTAGMDGKTSQERKMEVEVQEDWREDAKERRDADIMKPEKAGG